MGAGFWIKRFVTMLGGAFIVIGAAQMLRGHGLHDSAVQGAIWGVVAASVFTVARIFQSRQGQRCAICQDTPKMRQSSRDSDV